MWTPANISTALWLDAADASTITQSLGAVSQWNDKSGNENHLKQASGALQPAYGFGSEFAGKRVVSATTANMMVTDSAITVGTSSTIFLVYSQANNSRAYFISYTSDAAYVGTSNTATNFAFVHGSTAFNHPTPGTPSIFTSVSAPTDYEFFFDGTSAYTSATEPNVYDGNTGVLILNSRSNTVASFSPNAEYAEILIINNALSLTDRQLLEGYLAHKWGLTAGLPSDHPYKTVRP